MNEAVAAAADDLAININERPATFFLGAYPLPSDVIYQMTPRTFDLLLLAESVFAADFLISRGGSIRSDLGSGLGARPPVRRAGQRSRLLELGS